MDERHKFLRVCDCINKGLVRMFGNYRDMNRHVQLGGPRGHPVKGCCHAYRIIITPPER
jgi:hypothetical protein